MASGVNRAASKNYIPDFLRLSSLHSIWQFAAMVWVGEMHGPYGLHGRDGRSKGGVASRESMPAMKSTYPEIAANAALVLIGVACALLDRQIEAQAAAFTEEGGFTERLHRIRTERRKHGPR